MRYLMQQVVRASRFAKRVLKPLRKVAPWEDKQIVFIMGCQRSGTTLMRRIFDRDFRSVAFNDLSVLTDSESRLKDLSEVEGILREYPEGLIVIKALCESHRATELLDRFPTSTIVWMYRNYQDVAASSAKLFGPGIKNLQSILGREDGNWRYESVSDSTLGLLDEYFHEGLTPPDAHSLFWYTRNIMVFEKGMEATGRVKPVSYTKLTSEPVETMRSVYEFMGLSFPGRSVVSEVDTRSVNKGRSEVVASHIDNLCSGLLQRLDAF